MHIKDHTQTTSRIIKISPKKQLKEEKKKTKKGYKQFA
jgi:hypothetical protein